MSKQSIKRKEKWILLGGFSIFLYFLFLGLWAKNLATSNHSSGWSQMNEWIHEWMNERWTEQFSDQPAARPIYSICGTE